MSYESRLYFCRRYEDSPAWSESGEPMRYNASETIAEINLSCVGNEVLQVFYNTFKTETDFGIYMPDENGYTVYDKYGKRLCYAKAADIIDDITEAVKADEEAWGGHYWRYDMLKAMIQAFAKHNDIYVVHYGY